jgi:P-type Cu+ transporter
MPATAESVQNEQPTKAGKREITRLSVEGMTCGNCARHVAEAIQTVPGVHSALVNLESNEASVRWKENTVPAVEAVIQAVAHEGYTAKAIEATGSDAVEQRLAGWAVNLLLGVPVTMGLMAAEWVFGIGQQTWFAWIALVLAGVVQVFAGGRFYRGAWSQLRHGGANMDTLVALGSTTAFGYSTWALLSGHAGHYYFMEASAIITLISVGHWMEARVSARASDALRGLLNLAPPVARKRTPAGEELEVAASQVLPGDVLVLRPGERVPADGTVVEGASAADESMLTGESLPVDKAEASPVYAGTLNVNGRLVVRVTSTGEETALAQIIAVVQRAQSSRAAIQRIGDRISGVFVPVVVAVALVAALWWGLGYESAVRVHSVLRPWLWPAHLPSGSVAAGFIIASAVLIIACPCAMGLATPAAIMAAANAAAQRGILIRDGIALEKAGQVTAVVFDKTGTLTIGRPGVTQTWKTPAPPAGIPNPLALAAALARHSNHPLSRAIATLGHGEMPFEDWREIPGSGIQARLPGFTGKPPVRLGSRQWLESCQIDLAAGNDFANQLTGQGATLIGVASGQRLLAWIAVMDAPQTGARSVINQLSTQGLKTFLLTGDNPAAAAGIARLLGIPEDRVKAGVRPADKAEFVRNLQQNGERVAFVGDGINDGPALEQADLGLAVSRATDVAREASDIVLLRPDMDAVPETLALARAALRTIKQNLFWAFFYNGVGIPLAALGFMSPILCAAAMGLSDLVVIGNALRLRTRRFTR